MVIIKKIKEINIAKGQLYLGDKWDNPKYDLEESILYIFKWPDGQKFALTSEQIICEMYRDYLRGMKKGNKFRGLFIQTSDLKKMYKLDEE